MSCFADRIKDLRKKSNLYQKDIAKLLNIGDRQYRCYEAGTVDPPTSKTRILAEFYKVSIDYLVGRTDNPKINK